MKAPTNFNVPQTGAYADEGRLRAGRRTPQRRRRRRHAEHLLVEGPEGNGINGKKVAFVTGDTQTKSDAARASAKRMIEKDGAVMITGGSSSGVAIAVQALCQEAGVIFMAGLTHSNDTTGKDKPANGFRHFFNTDMSGAALAPVLKNNYGTDRKAYHLTADYNWGWSPGRLDPRSTPKPSAGKPSNPSAPRSAQATSRSTSRRF
jgi:branched-chain amino acid transport system substrate-binding protein